MPIVKTCLNIILLLFFLSSKAFAQSNDTLSVPKDSLALLTSTRLDTLKKGVNLWKDWSYHSGDDSTWAERNFNDSSWVKVRDNFKVDGLNGEDWTGIGWFRKKFRIDSTLFNKIVVVEMTQKGASEIYVNGKHVKSLGKIDPDPEKEERYNPQNLPFPVLLDTSEIQVIAVRYSNQKAKAFSGRYGNFAKDWGFTFRINSADDAFERKSNSDKGLNVVFGGFLMFFLTLAIVHFLMFTFYSKGKENLYFSFFASAVAVIVGLFIFQNSTHEVNEFYYFSSYLLLPLLTLTFACYIFFLYAIFYPKMPRQFPVIIVLGTIIGVLPFAFPALVSLRKYVLVIFILLLNIEGLRVIIWAIRQKKRNSLIIGFGVLLLFSLFVALSLTSLFSVDPPDWLAPILIIGGIFSLPITMSIYLARENRRTRTDLENRIVEVQELSEKAIEQEKKEAELKVENARKEVELQKAAELKSAYENLETAHENLKSTQAQLIQAEKMASLGELTAGIAHEIQNPLNFVNNFSELNSELIDELKEELATGNATLADEIATDIKDNEQKINHHGKRAESIVKGMLLHSRGSSGLKEPTDINALADEYLRLSYHGFRAKDKSFNADFKLETDETLPAIEAVPQDIGRVLLNLINNAFFAVNEKAKQTIEGYKPEVLVSTKYFLQKDGKGLVEIRIKDNGTGIPESIKEKIFQPFFTTKPTGQGTGLGLSLSYDIVKAHKGELKVESNHEGTEFIIVIPKSL